MQWASGFFFFFFFFFFFLSVFRQFSFHIICIYDILYIIYDLNCRKCWGCADIDNQAMASITSSTFHHSLILINNNSSNRTKKSFSHPPSEAGFPHLLSSSSNSGKLRSLPFSSSSWSTENNARYYMLKPVSVSSIWTIVSIPILVPTLGKLQPPPTVKAST